MTGQAKQQGASVSTATARQPDRGPIPRIDSEAIFDDRDCVILVHAGEEYRLRVTRNDKLILNK